MAKADNLIVIAILTTIVLFGVYTIYWEYTMLKSATISTEIHIKAYGDQTPKEPTVRIVRQESPAHLHFDTLGYKRAIY
jgi:hypothetical protein